MKKAIVYLITLNIILIHISCRVTPTDEEIYKKNWESVPTEVYSSDVTHAEPDQVDTLNGHIYHKTQCADGLYCWRHIQRCPVCLGY